jgi:putative transposase
VSYAFIEEHRGEWPVAQMCETLSVSTTGYYSWRDREASVPQQRREELTIEIHALHAEVKARYGSPRRVGGSRPQLLREHGGTDHA